MECRKCGVQLSDDAKFCKNCGCRVEPEELKPIQAEEENAGEENWEFPETEEIEEIEETDQVNLEEEYHQLEEQLDSQRREYYKNLEQQGIEQKELRTQINKWKTDVEMLRTENYWLQSDRKISDKQLAAGKVHLGKIRIADAATEPQRNRVLRTSKETRSIPADIWITVAAGVVVTLIVLFMGWVNVYGSSIPIYKVSESVGSALRFGNSYSDMFHTGGMSTIVGTMYALGIFCCCIPIPYWIYVYVLATKKDAHGCRAVALFYNIVFCIIFIFFVMAAKSMVTSSMSEYGELGSLFGNAAASIVELGAAPFWLMVVGAAEYFLTRHRTYIEEEGKSEVYVNNRTGAETSSGFPVMNFNPSLRFRIPSVFIEKNSREGWNLNLQIVEYADDKLESLLCTVDMYDNYGEIYRLEGCRMNVDGNGTQLKTENIPFIFEPFPMDSIRYAKVYIEKYIIDSVVCECKEPFYELQMGFQDLKKYRKSSGIDAAVGEYIKNEQGWICTCGVLNMEQNEKCWNCTRTHLQDHV